MKKKLVKYTIPVLMLFTACNWNLVPDEATENPPAQEQPVEKDDSENSNENATQNNGNNQNSESGTGNGSSSDSSTNNSSGNGENGTSGGSGSTSGNTNSNANGSSNGILPYTGKVPASAAEKFYKPSSYKYDLADDNSELSWKRSRESEHFYVFWEKGFGYDPNSTSLPESMRVDVDDLLAKAEQFYKLNVETLKMATPGYGKSYLDKYKMQIILRYQTEWLATGSGYDNVIGALWVNPSTCKPVGKTIAHEIGHTFQYQIYCDKLLNGHAPDMHAGWRYGFGPNGQGGNGFWEQSAQFQAYQLYPELAIEQNYRQFIDNAHRHFNDENMRYQSFWFMYYFTEKYGIESFSKLWNNSYYPEDPLEAYTRLIANNNWNTTWKDYYEYAAHAVTFDFKAVKNYYNPKYTAYCTDMVKVNGKYRPTDEYCPTTSGFNVISLFSPEMGDTAEVTLNTLSGNESNFRFGFVGIKNGKADYGTMASGKNTTAKMTVNKDYDSFYLVVVAAPDSYRHHMWDDDSSNDEKWSYEVSFKNTGIDREPTNGSTGFGVELRASKTDYEVGYQDLSVISVTKKMSKAFGIPESDVIAKMVQPKLGVKQEPQEGKIVLVNTNADGSISAAPTANKGYWCNIEGNTVAWSNEVKIYFEYDAATNRLYYGLKPGANTAGTQITVHPTFIYRKDGKDYKFQIDMIYIFK